MALEEQWVILDGLPKYAVSNYGRVIHVKSGRELEIREDEEGYSRVVLKRHKRYFEVYLHKLVALCYFLNYRPGITVRHLNGVKADCSVLNLTLTPGEEKNG